MLELELKETIRAMCSNDYKERFRAEYIQTFIRYNKLANMVRTWDNGKLKFTPTCPREMYDRQLKAMYDYLKVLEERAILENIDLIL